MKFSLEDRKEIILYYKEFGFRPTCAYFKMSSATLSRYLKDTDLIGFRKETRTHKLSDILVENSTYAATAKLKKKLYLAKLKIPKCEQCKTEEIWMGKFLCLQLDHINGVRHDNRIENLRILCPNCHSQTITYAGKNKGMSKNGG